MFQIILNYLFIGVLINLAYDIMLNVMGSAGNEFKFTMLERFVFGLLWPISLTLIIIKVIKVIRDNK